MEEILQDIHEFPNYGFIVESFLILIFLPCIYFLRPRYYPVKYWRFLGVIFVSIFLLMLWYKDLNTVVLQENIEDLEKSQGILMHKEIKKGQDGGFYLADENEKKIMWLDFMLCGHEHYINPYIDKNITVYHKGRVVYQMETGGVVVYGIERNNEKVWLGILLYFMEWLLFFVLSLTGYLLMLRTLNNDYKKE